MMHKTVRYRDVFASLSTRSREFLEEAEPNMLRVRESMICGKFVAGKFHPAHPTGLLESEIHENHACRCSKQMGTFIGDHRGLLIHSAYFLALRAESESRFYRDVVTSNGIEIENTRTASKNGLQAFLDEVSEAAKLVLEQGDLESIGQTNIFRLNRIARKSCRPTDLIWFYAAGKSEEPTELGRNCRRSKSSIYKICT